MGIIKNDMDIWWQEIKKHVEKCRAALPIPGRNALSRPQVLQFYIIKGSLLSWVSNFKSTTGQRPAEKDGHRAGIVFTSTFPGLVAAQEIIQEKDLPLVSLYPDELSVFLQSFPDKGYKYHMHIWSYFLEELDSGTKKIAERYPLNSSGRYWLHVEGIMSGPKHARGTEHLWSWNGSHAELIKKSFLHWAT